MRCITPFFAPRLAENVLIFAYNPKFKHPRKRIINKVNEFGVSLNIENRLDVL
jgi:hypothetical protein